MQSTELVRMTFRHTNNVPVICSMVRIEGDGPTYHEFALIIDGKYDTIQYRDLTNSEATKKAHELIDRWCKQFGTAYVIPYGTPRKGQPRKTQTYKTLPKTLEFMRIANTADQGFWIGGIQYMPNA